MREVSGQIRGLEQVGASVERPPVAGEKGRPSQHDSDFYKKTLASYASITPADGARIDAAVALAGRR